MATIVTRQEGATAKGSPLTNAEVDNNFININTELVNKAAKGANSDITSMSGITGNISTPDSIQFDTATAEVPGVGKLVWNNGEATFAFTLKGGTLDHNIGTSIFNLCYNGTGASIPKGTVVYVSGAQGQRISITRAQANSEATSARTFGITAEAIANGAEGLVIEHGVLTGVDTSAYTAGASLYLSPTTAGGLTATKPSAPNHLVYIGNVISVNASSGRIFVRVQNGYELSEIHDVAITSIADNNLLQYNSTSGVWENVAGPAGAVVGTTDTQTLTNKTISGSNNTLTNINLTSSVTGTLPVANGGTGKTSASSAFIGLQGYQTTVATSGITVLTNTSPLVQFITGTGLDHTMQLPDTATLALGWQYLFVNNCNTGIYIYNSLFDAEVQFIDAGELAVVTCVSTSGNGLSAWDSKPLGISNFIGYGAIVKNQYPQINSPTILPNSLTITSAATLTPNNDSNSYFVTALATAATISAPAISPQLTTTPDGMPLIIRIRDNGTARALTWTTTSGGYRAVGVTLPTTTVANKVLYVGCKYNSVSSFWDVIAVAQQA